MALWINDNIASESSVASSSNGEAVGLVQMFVGDITATVAGNNAANTTFVSGVAEVQTLTFPTFAGATSGDYIVVSDASGGSWAIYLDKTGSAPAPTGAAYAAVAAPNKSSADITLSVSAADVAAVVELAFNALTGFTALITTNDTAADGTMLLTQTAVGPVVDPSPHNADDSGVGSIAGVETTPGSVGDVDVGANTLTIEAHGYLVGMKFTLTTTTTLPTGLSLATPYYVIVIDADTIKVATSQANALLGTPVDITGVGVGTHTVVVATALAGSIKLQKSNDKYIEGSEPSESSWVDITSSSQNFAAATKLNWVLVDIGFSWIRVVTTVTSGTIGVTAQANFKGC